MEHREYRLLCPGADTAVLFLHGIAGTPNQFAPFLPRIPQGVSVYNLLLEGHGAGVRDFSRASMRKWEDQVRQAVEELAACHSRILIVGHSMGTLFAIEQAVREPKVAGLFLLAVPLRIFLRPQLAVNAWKVFFDCIGSDDAVARAARDSYGIERDGNLLHYIGWIPRYLELFRKIRKTRTLLPKLQTPGLVFQSAKDEMVSRKAVEDLQVRPSLSVTELPRSCHYYYAPEEEKLLLERFEEILGRLT